MNRFLRCVAVAIPAVGMLVATQAPAAESLRAHYCFDSDLVSDCSDYGNDGIVRGNVTQVPGKRGNGAHFNGYLDIGYIEVPNTPSLTFTEQFTIAYWIKLESFAGQTGYGGAADFGSIFPVNKGNDRGGVVTTFDGQSADQGATVQAGLAFNFGVGISAPKSYVLGQWVHMAYTFDRASGELVQYIDGVPVKTVLLSGIDLSTASTANLFLGAQGPVGGGTQYQYPMTGVLDDVRIYDRALGKAAIKLMYKALAR